MSNNKATSRHAQGGGNATAAGVEFEANLGAWFASHMIAERALEPRFLGHLVKSVRFETEAPVDDIMVETNEGWIFVQAKTNLALSKNPNESLGKVAEQAVRLWLSCKLGNGGRGWDRPLKAESDRILLAVGSHAPSSITQDLADALTLQRTSNAPLSKARELALNTFKDLLANSWQAITGESSSTNDVHAILNIFIIAKYDFDGADRQLAAEILSSVIASSQQSNNVFSIASHFCQKLMRERNGCDAAQLRQALQAIGIELAEPPSFNLDVKKLREYSAAIQTQLAEYEVIEIAGIEARIRRECTATVVDIALANSVLLVGEPGAGKSAVMNASAKILRDTGHDVLELAIDRLPVQTLPELSSELGLSHSIREVLLNWPGSQPAFLFIDALDATRGGRNEAVFRTLITEVLSFEQRKWHVIASIRTFDLRLGEQFRKLFKGSPINAKFADPQFKDVAHVHVGPWTEDELEQLFKIAPTLKKALDAGGTQLRELAYVPFNCRLIADLINGGIDPGSLGDVRTQVQLLDLYWNKRIEKYGVGAELCLKAAVAQMVRTHTLRADKLKTAQQDPTAFDDLLRETVIVLRSNQHIAFRHHLLFDYAASRVFLDLHDFEKTSETLSHQNAAGLLLAPALIFSLQQIWWSEDASHSGFWEIVIKLAGNSKCDPVSRSVVARTACELPSAYGDAIKLSSNIKTHEDNNIIVALSHVVGGLVVRLEAEPNVILDPWFELADAAADKIAYTMWPLRTLLFSLSERAISSQNKSLFGKAARKLLSYGFSHNHLPLIASGITFVAESYGTDTEASRKLLRKIFEPQHFDAHADQEIPWLVRGLKPISVFDPDFVAEIYSHVFSGSISDTSKTAMGNSQIMPLLSNRKQDYEHSWWELGQFFPTFIKEYPIQATLALIKAVYGYAVRKHGLNNTTSVGVQTTRGEVHLRTDHSHIWAWNIDEQHGDYALGLIREFVHYLDEANTDDTRDIIQKIISNNELAVIWSRVFMSLSKRAQILGDLLWPIATAEPFLVCVDTRKDTIDFIAARYPYEEKFSREQFERKALTFDFSTYLEPVEARKRILSTLFTSIGVQHIATDEARAFISSTRNKDGDEDHNSRPFSITTRAGNEERWWWLKEATNLDSVEVKKILDSCEKVESTLKLKVESTDDSLNILGTSIDLLRNHILMVDKARDSLPEKVVETAYAIAAQGVAKLSYLPVEKLKAQHNEVQILIELTKSCVERLPSMPVDPEREAKFEEFASWGSPNAAVSTAEAVMGLCRINESVVVQLTSSIQKLRRNSDPAARMQIAERLTVLWDTNRQLMWELADSIVSDEPNRGVLKFFANYFLSRTIHADTVHVEQLVFSLYEKRFDRSEKATSSLYEEVARLITLLWVSHDRSKAKETLKSWIADPIEFKDELHEAISFLRSALVLKYQSNEARDQLITQRAQEFYGWLVDILALRLGQYFDTAQEHTPSQEGKEQAATYAKLLDSACNQIYFASGAFRTKNEKEDALPSIEAKNSFFNEIRPALEKISDVGTPSTIYHILELLEFLSSAEPEATFDLVARALLGAGKKHGYQFESLGADQFVQMIGTYLADHRELFMEPSRRQRLIECLDIFMEAGWPAARRLLYRLPELLR